MIAFYALPEDLIEESVRDPVLFGKIKPDFRDHSLTAVFLSSRLIFAGKARKGVASGSVLKHLHIGVAAASYCVIGGMPSTSSIVLRTEVVV